MSDGFFYLTIFAVALATLACRGAFIIPPHAHHLSKRFDALLEFTPISATSAIAFSSLVYSGNNNGYDIDPERLIIGVLAFLIAYVTKSAAATFIGGFAIILFI